MWTFPDGVVRIAGTVSWGNQDCVSEDHFARTDYYYSCISQYLEESSDPCDGVGYQGYCDGNTAVWCDNNQLVSQDCELQNKICGVDGSGNYRCVDPCDGETITGRCDGNTAVWCERGQVYREDCSLLGKNCSLNGEGYYRCIEVREDAGVVDGGEEDIKDIIDVADPGNDTTLEDISRDECKGIDYFGRCEDNIAIWCEHGVLRSRDCEACGQKCEWIDGTIGYYCKD